MCLAALKEQFPKVDEISSVNRLCVGSPAGPAADHSGLGRLRIAGLLLDCAESMPWVGAWFGPAARVARCCAARIPATCGSNARCRPGLASWTSAASGPGTHSMFWFCRADPAINPASIRRPMGAAAGSCCFTNPDADGFLGWASVPRSAARLSSMAIQRRPPGRTDHVRFGLLQTRDGGNTWSPAAELQPLPGESVFAASNSAMTASGGWIWLGTSKARVLRTRRSAHDWQSAQTPLASGNDSSGVFSLAFRDQKHGIAVGGNYRKPEEATGTAAYTSDGGEHWSVPSKPPHGYRSAVAWDASDQAWITVGSNGSDISYDDGDTWQWLDSGNWNALSLPWAVGPNGQIGKLGTLPAHPPQGCEYPGKLVRGPWQST